MTPLHLDIKYPPCVRRLLKAGATVDIQAIILKYKHKLSNRIGREEHHFIMQLEIM